MRVQVRVQLNHDILEDDAVFAWSTKQEGHRS